MLNTSVPRIICWFLFLVTIFEVTFSDDAPIIGPADLTLIDLSQCDISDTLPSSFVFERKKFNRTTEIFDGVITLDVDLDDSVAIYINVAKWGDGGYKPNFVLFNDTSVCNFFFTYLKRGIRDILSSGGRPETCPIAKGKIIAKNYKFDSRDLPDKMVYGNFKATVTLVKNEEVVLCYVWFVESKMKSTGIKLQ